MVESRLHGRAVLDLQMGFYVAIAGSHVVASIDDAPEVADRVLEGFRSEHEGVGHGVQEVHFGSDFISGLLDRIADQFVLRPVACLVIAATVEDDLASLTADQALLGLAGATLWVSRQWCADGVVCHGCLFDLSC